MSDRPRVGFLSHAVAWGGSEWHTLQVASRLQEKADVTILQLDHSLFNGRKDLAAGIHLVTLAGVRPAAMRLAGWRRMVRQYALTTVVQVKGGFSMQWSGLDLLGWAGQADVVRIEHSFPPAFSTRTSRRHFRGLLPGLGFWHLRYRWRQALHRAGARSVVTVAERCRDRLVQEHHYSADQVWCVPNGVDTVRFRFNLRAREAARDRWGLPREAFVLGAVTRLSQEKRIDLMLAVLGELRRCRPDLDSRLVLVGEGPISGPLRAAAEAAGLAPWCHWAGASTEPWLDYPAFDCVLLTSDREGMPYALLEAMSCERPVVACATGGAAEVIRSASEGLVVPQSVEAVAEAVMAVLDMDPSARGAMGDAARLAVTTRHDPERLGARLVRIILGDAP